MLKEGFSSVQWMDEIINPALQPPNIYDGRLSNVKYLSSAIIGKITAVRIFGKFWQGHLSLFPIKYQLQSRYGRPATISLGLVGSLHLAQVLMVTM